MEGRETSMQRPQDEKSLSKEREGVSDSRDVSKLEAGGWASAQSLALGVPVPGLPTCRIPCKRRPPSSFWCHSLSERIHVSKCWWPELWMMGS